ncbi:hypothetical protein JR316_0002207 [Psilocybe cubensis]|uniref:DUF7082 domain-containing protein n=2 Tax=Psilocybe cubensis TaxID=181762 RepID=A0A8H8CP87_PSICU|nr:hypothetical protein JR316_0002207 [Psilocybe cubensis]KAH9485299.1 hypothetical protein JR316_0002207 [Psilocybe cubensis]
MASPEHNSVVSPAGIIHVLGYTPTEGDHGVPITVRIHFQPDLATAMYVRLVVGTKAVPTKVRLLPSVAYGRWQLHAAAPPLDKPLAPSPKVLLSVQALDDENTILDSVTFGEFTYWSSDRRSAAASSSLPRLHIPESATTIRRRSNNVPSPNAPDSQSQNAPQRSSTRLHRRMKAQSLIRTKHHPANIPEQDELYAQTPVLDLVTPLSSICSGWSPAEIASGRRLVRFARVQDGRRLIVSCESIQQEDYCENDSVISCIYRRESDTCYVTSVDVIYLLERLTNGEFPVEEKNRIRRNLEGLRPTTVSKHKSGFGDFFQLIMDFPDPKPRNIEKDLKVFEWNLLGQALEKILSKYSIYTSPTPESAPSESPPIKSPEESPELYAVQLSYPPPEDPNSSRFLDQKMPKFEGYPQDDFTLTTGSQPHSNLDVAPFPSPVDSVVTTSSSASSSASAFPLFTTTPTTTDATAATASGDAVCTGGDTSHLWTPSSHDFKPVDNAMPLDNFGILSSYEVVEPGVGGQGAGGIHSFVDNPNLDFGIYDNYTTAFGGISDDALASLAEPYNI